MSCCLCRGDYARLAPGTSENKGTLFHNPNVEPRELLHKISPGLPLPVGPVLKELWRRSGGEPPRDRHENESAR